MKKKWRTICIGLFLLTLLPVFIYYESIIWTTQSGIFPATFMAEQALIANATSFNEVVSMAADTRAIIRDKGKAWRGSKGSTKLRTRLNIILIIVDDLRPQLAAYNGPYFPYPQNQVAMYTPNIDILANSSLVFLQAYCQFTLCGPSRASMMTSRRLDTTRVTDNEHYWRNVAGNFTTFPQYFVQHGYQVIGVGKVFHKGRATPGGDSPSWSEPYYGVNRYDGYYNKTMGKGPFIIPVDSATRAADPLSDDIALEIALERLRHHAPAALNGTKPFLLAVGIGKPHTPLICPDKYFKHYPLESSHALKANNISLEVAGKMWDVASFRQAYFACVSYVDELIGLILTEVENQGLSNSTIVSLVADHGFMLGENHHFGKYSNSELATHVPMILRIPGRTDSGVRTSAVVELLDLFPTLVDAAGLPVPASCPHRNSSHLELCIDGVSLLPLLDQPDTKIKPDAMSQIQTVDGKGDNYNIYSLRDSRYRYTSSARMIHTQQSSGRYIVSLLWNHTDSQVALYDYHADPGEHTNLIHHPEYREVQERFQTTLQQRLTDIHDVLTDNSRARRT